MSYVIAGYGLVFGTLAVYGAWLVLRGRRAAALLLADEARRSTAPSATPSPTPPLP